jgi:hypothetical protein
VTPIALLMDTTASSTVIQFVDCLAQNNNSNDLGKPITISLTISGILPQNFRSLLESVCVILFISSMLMRKHFFIISRSPSR